MHVVLTDNRLSVLWASVNVGVRVTISISIIVSGGGGHGRKSHDLISARMLG